MQQAGVLVRGGNGHRLAGIIPRNAEQKPKSIPQTYSKQKQQQKALIDLKGNDLELFFPLWTCAPYFNVGNARCLSSFPLICQSALVS